MAKKFYITTPIYYPSASPHLGHAYCTTMCDVIARGKRMRGFETFFLTGTDEHGEKIQKNAAAKGITPQQFVDEVVVRFKDLWKAMYISNDDFIRTISVTSTPCRKSSPRCSKKATSISLLIPVGIVSMRNPIGPKLKSALSTSVPNAAVLSN